MARFNPWWMLAIAGGLAACGPAGGGGGGGDPIVSPSVAPPKEYLGEPQDLPSGPSTQGTTLLEDVDFKAGNAPFTDAISQAAMASGSFAAGKWSNKDGVYMQEAPGVSTKLSIRRYNGQALGADGVLGGKYRVEVTGWIYRIFASDPALDQGVVSLLPFYVDETHYVICSAGPSVAEAWVANGQMPGDTWPMSNKLWGAMISPPRPVGTAVNWACDVDTAAHSLTIYYNGDRKATVTHPMITGNGYACLASNGDQLKYSHFRLYSLTGATASVTPPAAATTTPTTPSAPTTRTTPLAPGTTTDASATPTRPYPLSP
jgi:hypothetical protein